MKIKCTKKLRRDYILGILITTSDTFVSSSPIQEAYCYA
jgi:hypothetical protein